jgi:hypothetical protein
MSDVQTGFKSGYNACLKICNNFTANIAENPASWADLD